MTLDEKVALGTEFFFLLYISFLTAYGSCTYPSKISIKILSVSSWGLYE